MLDDDKDIFRDDGGDPSFQDENGNDDKKSYAGQSAQINSDSPDPASSSPQNGGDRDSRAKKGKKNHDVFKIVAITVIVIVLIVFTSLAAYFVTNYDISLTDGAGNIGISLIPKDGNQPSGLPGNGEESAPETGDPGNIEDSSTEYPEVSYSPTGDGTTLLISDVPEDSQSESGELTFQEIYKKVITSVVSIESTVQNGTTIGTGIIMSEDGYIITNYHVIEDGMAIAVTIEDGSEYNAVLIGADQQSDLAVLKIETSGLAVAQFGDSDSLEVGDTVVAIGNPLGIELKGTLTDGIISAINRDISVNGRTMTLLQTNAALNSGNSGGPLINIYGQVVGINTMKMSSYYSTIEGLGFAIPISTAKPIIDELIEKGYITGRPALGIKGSDIPAEAASFYKVPQGVYVESVDERSDAYSKGLTRGDIIVAFNGEEITDMEQLNDVKSSCSVGDTVVLTIYRGDAYMEVEVVLMEEANFSE